MLDLHVGDIIRCSDAEEMIDLMTELAQQDIETDFLYEHSGKKGLWLEVLKVDGEKGNERN